MNYKKAIFLLIYILSISTSFGQYYDTEFGQNRIQYKKIAICKWLLNNTLFKIINQSLKNVGHISNAFNYGMFKNDYRVLF